VKFLTDRNKYQTLVYGTRDGLASSEITCLAQDCRGYIWVGTSAGLGRFDGIKFDNFLKADDHFTGKIYAVKEDTVRKVLWVACDAGLCYFYNNELKLAHFRERDVTVYDIYFSKDQNMWVGTGQGPVIIPLQTIPQLISGDEINLSSFLLPQWSHFNVPNNFAYKITASAKGTVYVGGPGRLYSYNSGRLEQVWISADNDDNNDNTVGIVPANGDTVLFAMAVSGLYYAVGGKTGKIDDYGEIAADLIVHNRQIYYFCTGGVFTLYPGTLLLKEVSEVPENLNVWVSCLLVDNENNLWIGMHDNLLYQKPRVFFSYRDVRGGGEPELYSVFQKKNHQLLFGANRGKVYAREGMTFNNIFGTGRAVPHAEVKAIYEDNHGRLWLGTGYDGIVIVGKNKTWHFTRATGLATNSDYFFYEDAYGTIYTGGDGGFSKINFDSVAGQFNIRNFYYKVAGENLETFRNCIAGPDGTLWLGGQKGIFRFRNDSLQTYTVNGEVSLSVSDMKNDSAGNVWITTKGDGIWQCFFNADKLLKLKKIFTEKDGLVSNIWLSITIDHQNVAWGGGYAGISSIATGEKNTTITNYTSTDGFLSSNYQAIRLYCDNTDTIWVATSAGFTSFDARNPGINKNILLNFIDVALPGTSRKIGEFVNSDGLPPQLPYFLNSLDFHFKAFCFSDPQKITYDYRILGLRDTAWIERDNKGTVLYQNLSPGAYTFQVKASIDHKNFTRPWEFSFVIRKPFWLTGWFATLCVLLAVLIMYVIQKKWKRNIHAKHEKKIRTQQMVSENLQHQLEVEQVTNYFATSMSNMKTVDALLWDVARRCISKLNFEDCVIYLKDDQNNTFIQKAAWGPKSYERPGDTGMQSGDSYGQIYSPIEIPAGKGIVGAVGLTGIAEIIPDVTKDGRYIPDDVPRASEIAVPIIYDHVILGVIDSESSNKGFFSQRHLQILTTIAAHCAERIVKLRTEENLRRNELELLNTRNRLAEEKLTALRSQMNPHFIFNSLNSIQQFILKGEVDNANKYLSQFSRLIRLVLQYSEYNFITLEEEINMLTLYLSLEKTRFGNSFTYTIEVQPDIDADEIKIPNLMVQPFVENAIWHGLMHKESDRKIDISFQLKNDESIICEVTDNGIGRERAAEIKKMRSVPMEHKSRGMQLVRDKIDVLKQQFTGDVSIEIFDVTNSSGGVCGTKVLIQLPLQFRQNAP
jgi:ligand-binding sensor domain-containing protein